jgi:hypothetical protein
MAQNAAVDDSSEERGARQQIVEQVGNILTAIGHERLVIPGTAAKGDDNRLATASGLRRAQPRAEERRSQTRACRVAKEFATTPANRRRGVSQIAQRQGNPNTNNELLALTATYCRPPTE